MKPQSTKHLFARTVMPVTLLELQLYSSTGSNMKFLFALGAIKVTGQPNLKSRTFLGAYAPKLTYDLNCGFNGLMDYEN